MFSFKRPPRHDSFMRWLGGTLSNGPAPAPCYEKKRRWHKSDCKPAGHMLDHEIRASNGAARGGYETGQGCERRKDDPRDGE